ncbi:MAG TPA: CHASE domain-containing protein, partial [Noviherbaspirillum sp.]
SADNETTRAEFHAYVRQLEPERNFPGIQSLNFAPLVLAADRPAFERAVRRDTSLNPAGYPEFKIKPPGERPEYHVLSYLEPMEPRVLGHDMQALEWVAKSSAVARDTGQLMSSGRIIQIKGSEQIVGLAMRMPLYRKDMPLRTVDERRAAYFGSVGAGFDVSTLMQNAVHTGTLRVRLFDTGPTESAVAGTSDPDRLLYDSGAPIGDPSKGALESSPNDYFIKRVSMTVGPRVWEAEFSMHRSTVETGFDTYLPWIMLIGGLAGSTLLFSVYYSLATARRRAVELAREMTKDLRTSEASLAQTQQMARLGSWVLDPQDQQMTWSAETFRILGVERTRACLDFEDFLACIHPEERETVREGLQQALVHGQEFQMEHRVLTTNGNARWVNTIARRSRTRPPVLRGAMRDITERKQTMEALKRSQELLRELTAYQDRVKEDERKRIAREIHDELGQTLLALRIDVQMLEARTASTHPRLNEKVRGALNQIDATVKTIRGIINNLRPAVLDLGLTAAIEWQVAQFRRRSGITCELVMGSDELVVDDARATSLFRILQESLTNVIRHANASRVTIELQQEDDQLVMRITDNGVGIYPGDRRQNSFGLVGVEERVHALHGEFFITSTPGQGTTLTVHIPVAAQDRLTTPSRLVSSE